MKPDPVTARRRRLWLVHFPLILIFGLVAHLTREAVNGLTVASRLALTVAIRLMTYDQISGDHVPDTATGHAR